MRHLSVLAVSASMLVLAHCSAAPGSGVRKSTAAASGLSGSGSVHVSIPSGAPPIGRVAGGTLCGEILYVAEPRSAIVHEIDLRAGSRTRVFGMSAGELQSPETSIADCSAGRLYVVDRYGVAEYGLQTGTLNRRFERATGAHAALGPAFLEPGRLVLPALWFPAEVTLEGRDNANFLEGAKIGYWQLTGESTGAGAPTSQPLLDLLDPGCRNPATPCLRVGVDRLKGSESGYVGCQGGSNQIGIYSESGHLKRRIVVQSPRFVSDGSEVKPGGLTVDSIKWGQRNSTVFSCYTFGDIVAAVHVTFDEGDWVPGRVMPTRVHLNIYKVDGTPLLSDVLIAGLPVAKDAFSLYIVSSEDAGNEMAAEVHRVRITDADGKLRKDLLEAL